MECNVGFVYRLGISRRTEENHENLDPVGRLGDFPGYIPNYRQHSGGVEEYSFSLPHILRLQYYLYQLVLSSETVPVPSENITEQTMQYGGRTCLNVH